LATLDVGVVIGEQVVGKDSGEGKSDRPAAVLGQAPPSETDKDNGKGNIYGGGVGPGVLAVGNGMSTDKDKDTRTAVGKGTDLGKDIRRGIERSLDVGVVLDELSVGKKCKGKGGRPAAVPMPMAPRKVDSGEQILSADLDFEGGYFAGMSANSTLAEVQARIKAKQAARAAWRGSLS